MTLINALALATLAHAAANFPESRLITPSQGALLNSWANKTAGQEWTLCYTSFTMNKTSPAEFHKRCDPYKHTVSVATNTGGSGTCIKKNPPPPTCPNGNDPCVDWDGAPYPCVNGFCAPQGSCSIGGDDCNNFGTPCGAVNKGGSIFGGFADDNWSGHGDKGTDATFLFQLGPGKPTRYGPSAALCPQPGHPHYRSECSNANCPHERVSENCSCCLCSNVNDCKNTVYMNADPWLWPQWGYNGLGNVDLYMGGKDKNTALGASAGCTVHFPDWYHIWKTDGPGATYTGPVSQFGCGDDCKSICGGYENWFETDMEVWGIMMPQTVGV